MDLGVEFDFFPLRFVVEFAYKPAGATKGAGKNLLLIFFSIFSFFLY
jgi:hypothetical protein